MKRRDFFLKRKCRRQDCQALYTQLWKEIFQEQVPKRFFLSGVAVSGCLQKRIVLIPSVACDAFRNFLATDTQSGPRHCGQPLGSDFLFTIDANPEAAVVDTLQSSRNFARPQGLTIKR